MTPRQYEIALLVMKGMRNKQIAYQLGITEGTVCMHLHNIYTDTGIRTRTELAMAVREAEIAAEENKTMSTMEDEREPFAVRDYLDRPEVIESYIGDLQVQIEKLYALIQELKDQRSRSSLGYNSPGDLAHPVDS